MNIIATKVGFIQKQIGSVEDFIGSVPDFIDKRDTVFADISKLKKKLEMPDLEQSNVGDFEKKVASNFKIYNDFVDSMKMFAHVFNYVAEQQIPGNDSFIMNKKKQLRQIATTFITLNLTLELEDLEIVVELSNNVLEAFKKKYVVGGNENAEGGASKDTADNSSDSKPVWLQDKPKYQPNYNNQNKVLSNPKFHFQPKDKLNNPTPGLEFIQEMFHKYRHATFLYANIMQKFVEYLYKNDKTAMFLVMTMIEADKNFYLAQDIHTAPAKNKTAHLTNPALKRFGLIPITDSMPLDKLMKELGEESVKTIEKLKGLSKKINIGFIIIKRVTYTPVEFNIRNLIIKDQAEKYAQPAEYGLTKKIIEKFKTIKVYDGQKKWQFSYDVIGDGLPKFYVLETLDGEQYRCLAPWLQSTNYSLQKFRVQGLLDYISEKNQPYRATNYQAQALSLALPNMFIQKPLNVETFSEKIPDIPIHLVKQKLLKDLMFLAEKITKGKFGKSAAVIIDVLHDERIAKEFYNGILSMYHKMVLMKELKSLSGNRFPFSELFSSFIVEVDYVKKRFMKELHDGYSRDPLAAEVFADKKFDNICMKKIEDIFSNSINLSIRDKENPYAILQTKYMLLNYE